MLRILFLCSLFILLGGNLYSQNNSKDIVDISVSSLADSAKLNYYTIMLNINIKEGWHINSNKPFDNYLTPTSVKLKDSSDVRIVNNEYPAEQIAKLQFSDSDLSLYEGNVLVRITIESTRKKVQFEMQYQSCNNQTCLFPVQKTLNVNL